MKIKTPLTNIKLFFLCLPTSLLFSSCYTTMKVKNIKGKYNPDQIEEVKNYYAEDENKLVIQFSVIIERQKGIKHYYYELHYPVL